MHHFVNEKYSEFYNNYLVKGSNAVASFHSMLNKFRLKTDLGVICEIEDLKYNECMMDVFPFTLDMNLNQAFIETSKILKIVVVIPMTTAEPKRTFSKPIKSFLRNRCSMID